MKLGRRPPFPPDQPVEQVRDLARIGASGPRPGGHLPLPARRHWLFPGQHLLAAATRSHELGVSSSTVGGYGLILIGFPVIGLALGALSALAATESLAATEAEPDRLATAPAPLE